MANIPLTQQEKRTYSMQL